MYASKHCKESLEYLQDQMTLEEALEFHEYIQIRNAYDEEQQYELERETRRQQSNNRTR